MVVLVTGVDSQNTASKGAALIDSASVSTNPELLCQRVDASLKLSVRQDDEELLLREEAS